MTFLTRAAGRTAAALAFAAAALAAQPALGAEKGAIAVPTAAAAAVTPGIEKIDDVIAAATPQTVESNETAVPAIPLETPVVPDRARPLAELVADHAAETARDEQADCLAAAVYFESNGEPFAGQLAVAEVIINRSRSGRFADTICGVITQRSQFSFVRGGRIPSPPRTTQAWRNAVAIAHIALDDMADSPVATALFFHARRVSPGWRLQRLATVGNHVFYR